MKEIQVAIISEAAGIRVFYIAEDDPSRAKRLLRKTFSGLPRSLNLCRPLDLGTGEALHMEPGEIIEWRIGERINARSLVDPASGRSRHPRP